MTGAPQSKSVLVNSPAVVSPSLPEWQLPVNHGETVLKDPLSYCNYLYVGVFMNCELDPLIKIPN